MKLVVKYNSLKYAENEKKSQPEKKLIFRPIFSEKPLLSP